MSWILTHTGKHFDFLNPMPDMIDIMDIARGLSREARFSLQTKKMYTVAQLNGSGSYDGIGDLAPDYSSAKADVRFDIIDEEFDSEIMDGVRDGQS